METTMKSKLFLAAILAGALVGQAQADDCDDLVDQVDDLLAVESSDLNEEVLNRIVALRNQGAQECDEGDEQAATESLEEALSLFTQ
jgi:hypothetical protein